VASSTEVARSLSPPRGFGQTSRIDRWWAKPLLVLVGLSAFVAYATWAAFQGEYYYYGPYLSPFYSPELWGSSPHALFGPIPPWWPAWLPFSPAFLILGAPVGFRLTCYYYRGAYYKSFWGDPPACAVGEARSKYHGEQTFPLVLQNVHRYFLYLALIFIVILSLDAWKAFWWENAATGATEFHVGVGSLVLTVNAILLAGYTLGCHSLRHLVGGRISRLSRRPVRSACYGCVSNLNRRHLRWAWCSLVWVAFADLYVRLCAMGIWTDIRLF
jgi:hypothetical protein